MQPGQGWNLYDHGYDNSSVSAVKSGRADTTRYELESDGPLVATSGPMDMPGDYDQRWH